MFKELSLAARILFKRPGYAVSVISTLALGIGASTTMFSLFDAAVLRPLPFDRPERLVTLMGVAGPERDPRGASFPEIADWRTHNATLQDVVLYDEMSLNLRVGVEAVRVDGEMVSAGYFRLLGVSAALGRTFLPEEDATPDRDAVAVVSDRFWRQRLGGDAAGLQQAIYLNDRPVQIVGVMPPGFAGISFDTDVWVPSMMISLASAPGVVQNRSTRWLLALGRLKDDVTLGRAQEDLSRVAGILESQHPDTNTGRGVQVTGMQEALLGGAGGLILSLFGAVLLFLIVACSNVASLQLARAAARRREVAVRLALGARRWHLLRHMLAESLILAATAGILGALLAAWSVGGAAALTPDGVLPRFVQPALEPRALAFALLASMLVACLVAILPALSARSRDLADALREGARSAEPGLGSLKRPSTQKALVVAEIALAMVLLTSAGLMVRSLQRQLDVRVGFMPAGVTAGRVNLPGTRYPPEDRVVFVDRLEERLRRLPGVRAVAIGSDLPFTGSTSASMMLPDIAASSPDAAMRYFRHLVSPGYFETLGIPLVRGRAFTSQDRRGGPPVAIVNESGARRIWGDTDPVGRRFFAGRTADSPAMEIVGVVGDARFRDLTTDLTGARAEPDIYFPFAQRTDTAVEIAIRGDGGSTIPVRVLQAAVGEIDAGLPIYQVQPLDQALRQQTSTIRFASSLLSMFSGGALLLAALGLYGLVAYVTSLSRREIAIRLALGASARGVTTVIVRNGMTLVAMGVILGAIGSVAAGRALQTQLFQTSAGDPLTLASVGLLLLFVTALASLVPSRRAVRIDPQAALRD
jgi:predicted permease